MTAALDSYIFTELTDKYGLCPFNGIVGQYKGIFPDQLGQRTGGNFLKITSE
jgi:hypothetical protein